MLCMIKKEEGRAEKNDMLRELFKPRTDKLRAPQCNQGSHGRVTEASPCGYSTSLCSQTMYNSNMGSHGCVAKPCNNL
ncbi:hypothetical protein EPI10_021657 [Gossypium australe]|uniref:Uncharacterized protein n=1 Tax=Gossypium australe TaxID=47621 RepID=A0A5B6WIN9_9ROSI|nr:hypothetical protein EPI10_021657 [Gossypium australe]